MYDFNFNWCKKNIHEDWANFFWWFHSKSLKSLGRQSFIAKFSRPKDFRRRCAGNLESVASSYQKLQHNGDKWHLVTNIHQTVAPGTYIQHVFLACNCFSSFFDGALKTSSDVFVLGNAMGFFDNNIFIGHSLFAYCFSTLSCWISRRGRSLCLPHGEGAKVFNGWRQDIHAFKTRWMWVTTEAASFINKWICWTYYDQLLGSGMFTCTHICIYIWFIYIVFLHYIT